jgi:hypothetical protein
MAALDDDPGQLRVILETANGVGVESVHALQQHLLALGVRTGRSPGRSSRRNR